MGRVDWGRGKTRVLLSTAALCASLGALRAEAAAPLAPAQRYRVQGEGTLQVSGPRCCGDTRFTGDFEAAYDLSPSTGEVALVNLRLMLDDADVVVHDGFLGLFSSRIQLRCASASSGTPALGAQVSATQLKFLPGRIAIDGFSSEERASDSACAPATLSFAGSNDRDALLTHDPGANRFTLDSFFRTSIEGETYDLHVVLEGRYRNRPPQARLAFIPPVGPVPQGGCPAFQRWNGQTYEWVAEANSPAGLVARLRSYASDPDGGWAQGDVFTETWYDAVGTADRVSIGHGREAPSRTFAWGAPHQVELLAADHVGASSATACSFRVIDTRPPVVTPPGALTTSCSVVGGATPLTSAPLRAFLNGATASDVADASPVALPRRLGTVDITDTTFFPADGVLKSVSFRFRDAAGNVGQASANLRVKDGVAPALAVGVTPATLAPDHKYWLIRATLTASDNCGGTVGFRLLSVRSNAPELDASDVLDASLGTDDRAFFVFSRLAAPGVPRVYTITYEARDGAGNTRQATAKVTVG